MNDYGRQFTELAKKISAQPETTTVEQATQLLLAETNSYLQTAKREGSIDELIANFSQARPELVRAVATVAEHQVRRATEKA